MFITVEEPLGLVIYASGTTITFWANPTRTPAHPVLVDAAEAHSASSAVGAPVLPCERAAAAAATSSGGAAAEEPAAPMRYEWTVDGVVVTAHAAAPDWSAAGEVVSRVIQLTFTPRLIPANRRRNFVIGCTSSSGEVAEPITVRVAQARAVPEPQAPLSNAALVERFTRRCGAIAFTSREDEELERRFGLAAPCATYRVQNGTIPDSPGAHMGVALSRMAELPSFIAVTKDAYGVYDARDFDSMLHHESLHCRQFRHAAERDGFWRQVQATRVDGVYLIEPVCECEAWLSYLQDPETSYFFLYANRVFSQLDDYLWKSARLLAQMDRASPLAVECYDFLAGVALQARVAFAGLANLIPGDRHFVRPVPEVSAEEAMRQMRLARQRAEQHSEMVLQQARAAAAQVILQQNLAQGSLV